MAGEVSKGKPGPGGDVPAIAGNFDELAVEVGEIEVDLVGGEGGSAGIDAKGDADIAGFGFAGGFPFEVVENGGEAGGGGKGFVLDIALVEEPVAEGLGADGEGLAAEVSGGNDGEDASSGSGKGAGAIGDTEESFEIHTALRYSTGEEGILIFGS